MPRSAHVAELTRRFDAIAAALTTARTRTRDLRERRRQTLRALVNADDDYRALLTQTVDTLRARELESEGFTFTLERAFANLSAQIDPVVVKTVRERLREHANTWTEAERLAGADPAPEPWEQTDDTPTLVDDGA